MQREQYGSAPCPTFEGLSLRGPVQCARRRSHIAMVIDPTTAFEMAGKRPRDLPVLADMQHARSRATSICSG